MLQTNAPKQCNIATCLIVPPGRAPVKHRRNVQNEKETTLSSVVWFHYSKTGNLHCAKPVVPSCNSLLIFPVVAHLDRLLRRFLAGKRGWRDRVGLQSACGGLVLLLVGVGL